MVEAIQSKKFDELIQRVPEVQTETRLTYAWARAYSPRQAMPLGKRVVLAQRHINMMPYTDEMTILDLGELLPRKEFGPQITVEDVKIKKGTEHYRIVSANPRTCQVVVLRMDRRIVFICTTTKKKPRAHCVSGRPHSHAPLLIVVVLRQAYDPELWDSWTIKVGSEAFKTFLDGKPCREGLYKCKNEKEQA